MKKVVIIGGGASGLTTAIFAKNKENEVIILERNKDCGKKILITGNGKCNYYNSKQNINHYHSENEDLIEKIINKETNKQVLNFFDSLGIVPKIKNGYYYPFSNQAITIKNMLLLEAKRKKITMKNDFLVESITKKEDKFIIASKKNKITADVVVVATGSFACPKTGSDGMGYKFLNQLGHSIIKPLPALVQLKTTGNYLKDWSGIRTDVKLSLYENNKLKKEEQGEIQLTNYGISGICTFNLSGIIARGLDKNKKEVIKINFLPFLDFTKVEDYILWMDSKMDFVKNRTISEMLEAMLNYKLVNIILKESKINNSSYWYDLSPAKKQTLVNNLIAFEVMIMGTNSFNEAQVCSGGIPLTEINVKTMESKKIKDLYITGELLDVVGDCGGYNLTFAWTTGILAGLAIRENNHD